MIDSLLDRLAHDPTADVDVAEVGLWLAADEYPDLDVAAYLARLDDLAERARPYLVGAARKAVRRLVRLLFEEEGFAGNSAEYYDPRNSYLNEVMDRQLGIPITLSVLAMAVGRRAGLAVEGVGLPGHFIAKAVRGDNEILFDPFHGGRILTPLECEQLIEGITGRPFAATPELLSATPPGMIIQRMLNNLRSIYAEREDFARTARILGRQRQLVPGDVTLRRDLGITLVRAERPGPAIDHLKAYLESVPYGEDVNDVRQVLARAVADVARWN